MEPICDCLHDRDVPHVITTGDKGAEGSHGNDALQKPQLDEESISALEAALRRPTEDEDVTPSSSKTSQLTPSTPTNDEPMASRDAENKRPAEKQADPLQAPRTRSTVDGCASTGVGRMNVGGHCSAPTPTNTPIWLTLAVTLKKSRFAKKLYEKGY